ncbi:hypothetical protein D3C78_1111590 [compost metagenome]
MGISGVQAQLEIRKALIGANGIHLFAVRDGIPPKAGIQILPHRHKIAFRKTISGKRNLTIKLIKPLGIAETVGLAFFFVRLPRQPGDRLGSIERQRPKHK